MERIALKDLIKWKNSSNRKPLILQGARQVGKTWLMKEFGKLHFEKVAYFNFEKDKSLKTYFEHDFNVERILEDLSLVARFKLTPETLIIFDEIQACPEAITSLKYFCENAGEYLIISAGSLLGMWFHSGHSFPVGKVDLLTLYPLNFLEFLGALGLDMWGEYIERGEIEKLQIVHHDLMRTLKKYLYIGGMPAVVKDYVMNRDFESVRTEQNSILENYQSDFSKHIKGAELAKVRMVWNSLASQLAKENKKFIYGAIKKGARAKDFEDAILWLKACGLIHQIHCVKKPAIPLAAYDDLSAFKLFVVDVGLLSALSKLDAQVLLGDAAVFEEFKGALAEQYVLQEMMPHNKSLSIHYWTNDSATNEIDFLVQKASDIVPIEVKAGINLQSKSLSAFIAKFKSLKAWRFSSANYKQNEIITDYPLYATSVVVGH